ncbi:MAG: pantoate--beta-alanine ligase [Pseudomonadota bacterium]
MKIISSTAQMRAQVRLWKSNQEQVSLVPTMGNLHQGHLSLINLAKALADRVVVSIFVNALQFNQTSDFENYPRTLDEDLKQLEQMNIDAVFTPNEQDFYPHGIELAPLIHIPVLADEFCGKYRPGHFEGVATVVAKLFNATDPNTAVFGKKDYQQLLIIERLTKELNFDIKISAGETVREKNGLAMSSRNSRLSPKELEIAPNLNSTLFKVSNSFNVDNIQNIEDDAKFSLENHGFRVEYLSIRDARNLQAVAQNTSRYVVLAAVWLGDTRLIDNIVFQ